MPHAPSPLVGRASVLTELLRRARSGQGAVLTGPPGSGASRLLDEVQQTLRRGGARTARIRVSGPASPFLSLLQRSTRDTVSSGDRPALRRAVVGLRLDALVIEDARLLDAADGALVIELARAGTAIVADATGPGGTADALRTLGEEDRVVATPLGPLTDEEVTELAEHVLSDPIDCELANALVSASEGRPGWIGDLVQDGIGAGSIAYADGTWHLRAPLPVPRSVRTSVLEAFATLSPGQRGWIAAVATGSVIRHDLAARIAAPATIAAAEEAGWTRRDADATRIGSAPAAAAVLDSLDARARSAVLRRLIDAATAVQRPLEEQERIALAVWRIELGTAPDADHALALALLPDTAPAAQERLLRAALAGGAPAGPALADHLRRTRRPGEALRLIDAALASATSADERVALVRVASLVTGVVERRSTEALETLDAHIADHGPDPDLLAVRAGLLLLEGRPREAVAVATALLEVDEPGFVTMFAPLLVALGLHALGEAEAALLAAARFAALDGPERGHPEGPALARWLPAEIAVATAVELDPVEAVLAAERRQRPTPHRTASTSVTYTLACIRIHRADPASAVRLLRESVAGGGAWTESSRPRILAELTIAQALSGAVDDAGGTLDRLLRMTCPPVHRARVRLATAQLTASRGDLAGAAAITAEAAEEGRRRGLALDAFDAVFAGIRYGDATAPERLLALGRLPTGTGRDAQRAYAVALLTGDPAAVDAAAVHLWDTGLRLHALEAAARAADLGDPKAAGRLNAWLTRTSGLRLPGVTDRRGTGLTGREREVALLAAGGASDRMIAEELGVTVRTAQTHLGRAFGKLGIHRRTELSGLLDEP